MTSPDPVQQVPSEVPDGRANTRAMGHPLRRIALAGAAWVVALSAPASAQDRSGFDVFTAAAAAAAASVESDTVALRARLALSSVDDAEAAQRLAAAVAERVPGLDPDRLVAAWQATTSARRTVVFRALAAVGTPYLFGGTGPQGYDCSGLTRAAWQAVGVHLSHYTGLQRRETTARTEAQVAPGDLVFNLGADGDGHVMLALGADRVVVDAPSTGATVQVRRWFTVSGFGAPLP
jgi:cell wall-associated NlpC family hydrolase